MRNTTRALAASLLLLTAACSRNVEASSEPVPAASTAFDPVGLYDFVATMGIETRTGTLEIERNDTGGLRGEAWLEGEPDPAVIESGAVAGNHVQLTAFVGGGNQVTFELDFTGTTAFSGTIVAGGDVINVTGTRRAP
jgi:hypothetical protein